MDCQTRTHALHHDQGEQTDPPVTALATQTCVPACLLLCYSAIFTQTGNLFIPTGSVLCQGPHSAVYVQERCRCLKFSKP